jgi:hypothetical protein
MAKQLKILVLAAVVLFCSHAWAAFTFVNAQGANSTSSSNLTTANWSSTAGDKVICVITMFTQTINNVTDANSLAFTKTLVATTPGGGKVYLAYTPDASTIGANASYNVNVTTTGGPNELGIACGEFTPPASTTVALEVSNSASGSGTAASVSLAGVTAGDLVIGGASWDNTATPTAGSGYTIPTNGVQPSNGDASTHQPAAIEYNLNGAGGTTTVNMTTGSGFAIWGAAFKSTSSGADSGFIKERKLEQLDPS